MPNTSNISTPVKGMTQDTHLLSMDNASYSFAMNAVIEDFWDGKTQFLANEPSNRCSVEFPIGYQVVGFVEIIEQKRTIYFLHNISTGNSQIGEVYDCTYENRTDVIEQVYCKDCPEYQGSEITPLEQQKEDCSCSYKIILSSSCLNFSIHHKVDIEYKLTNCSLNLYFTDNVNERRFIYFDYQDNDFTKALVLQDRFKVETGTAEAPCETPIYINSLDCEKIKVHPNYKRICPEFIAFVNGGNLKAGAYQILVAYSDAYGNPMSTYFPATQAIPLFEKEIAFDTNYDTNKALHFRVDNINTSSIFKHYTIVIAQTIDAFTEFIQVATLPVTQTTYVYTGYEKTLKRLEAPEVLFKRPFYEYAKGVTKANNYLFYVGVQEYPIANLQRVVNNVKLQWETVAMTEGAYRDPANSFYYRTYQRDEIYSVGLIFEYDNGRETCAFHIPGRAPEASDLVEVTGDDIIEDITCEPLQSCNRSVKQGIKNKWEVYNTGTVEGTPHIYSEDCKQDSCWEYGDFSYWESTERYPNIPEVWGDLCGQCIRHHKFPDSCITHIHDSANGSKTYNDNNYIFPIGIKIDHQSVIDALDDAVRQGIIPAKDRDSIKSYRIVRGNRVGQKSVTAKGLIFNMLQYKKEKEVDDIYFPNYSYNDLNMLGDGDALFKGVERAPKTMFTFHSPDIHFTNSGLGNILKVETEEYGKTESYFTHSECQPKYAMLSNLAYTLSFGLGLAAALSATGEKSCKTITKKNDVKIKGEDGYGNYTFTGAGGGTFSYDSGSTVGATINTTDTEDHNTGTYDLYDKDTGTPLPSASGMAAEETITTCKGEPYQIFNSNVFILGLIGGVNQLAQKTILAIAEMNKIVETLRALIPKKNLSAQYNSIGKYNNYKCVAEGNKKRLISKSSYLTPTIVNVDEPSTIPDNAFTSIKINNWNRESTVYLKLEDEIVDPTVNDNSKTSMNAQFPTLKTEELLDTKFTKDISSYYVSVKNDVLNQYGQVCDITYLETTGCSFYLDKEYTDCTTKVFGGDTFINRFALKRKMPIFIQNMCGLPDNSDVLYKELNNVGTVARYFFNTPEPLLSRLEGSSFSDLDIFSLIATLTSENDREYDVRDPNFFYQKGLITLFSYGIPYFLVESDINVDYRTGQNRTDKDFFPHNTDLKEWLEEKNVPIETDNTFYYNKTYSKQNLENAICTSCIIDPRDLICQSTNYNRIIYSETSAAENKADNWMIYKANNYYDFDLTKGNLITADGIEDDKVLVRLEQGTQIFNAYETLQASGVNIQVGTGGMFKTAPKDIAITDLGYGGTQHTAILHTEFGHIWADAERGQVFKLATGGQGIEDISNKGMKSWFRQQLPFEIKKYFPKINVDHNLNGIGLHYGYDRRFNRFLITKLDYKPLVKGITYSNNKFYYEQQEIQLWNPKYFCNKGWTMSYNFFTNSWTSFHSYTPLFYVQHINTFDSSIQQLEMFNGLLTKKQKVYTHNTTNKSYQVFYSKLAPFIVETNNKPDLYNHNTHSIEYNMEAIRYHNEFDSFYNKQKTFNKAIIYNDSQTSGVLNLNVVNPNDFSQSFNYPKLTADGLDIIVTNSENVWKFNNFYNVVKNPNNNIPIFIYDCNNVSKQINPKAVSYDINDLDKELIKGRMTKTRYIQDKESNYKFIFIFGQNNQRQSFR